MALVAAIALALPQALLGQGTPVGLWHTVSDVDGKPTAAIEIREVNGEFVGVVRALLGRGARGQRMRQVLR